MPWGGHDVTTCGMPRPLSPPRVVFAVLAIIGAGQLFAGCAKTDPLDEPVDARTMNKFIRWQEKHVRPLGEPIAQHGPFVMNTTAELHRAVSDFQRGVLAG